MVSLRSLLSGDFVEAMVSSRGLLSEKHLTGILFFAVPKSNRSIILAKWGLSPAIMERARVSASLTLFVGLRMVLDFHVSGDTLSFLVLPNMYTVPETGRSLTLQDASLTSNIWRCSRSSM